MFPIRASLDPGGLVPAAGSDQLAIRRKGHGNDSRGVGLKREEFFAGPGINYLFAILVLSLLYIFNGQPVTPPQASAIVVGSAAGG